MYNFYIGQRVQIKTWDEMVKDGAKLNYEFTRVPWLSFNNPNNDIVFPRFMEYTCGAKATIKGFSMDNQVLLVGFSIGLKQTHTYTLDMIKPYVREDNREGLAGAEQGIHGFQLLGQKFDSVFQELGKIVTLGVAGGFQIQPDAPWKEIFPGETTSKGNQEAIKEAWGQEHESYPCNWATKHNLKLGTSYRMDIRGVPFLIKIEDDDFYISSLKGKDRPWQRANSFVLSYLDTHWDKLEEYVLPEMIVPPFKPKKGENYFFVNIKGFVKVRTNGDFHIDHCNILIGNSFRVNPSIRQIKNISKMLRGE